MLDNVVLMNPEIRHRCVLDCRTGAPRPAPSPAMQVTVFGD